MSKRKTKIGSIFEDTTPEDIIKDRLKEQEESDTFDRIKKSRRRPPNTDERLFNMLLFDKPVSQDLLTKLQLGAVKEKVEEKIKTLEATEEELREFFEENVEGLEQLRRGELDAENIINSVINLSVNNQDKIGDFFITDSRGVIHTFNDIDDFVYEPRNDQTLRFILADMSREQRRAFGFDEDDEILLTKFDEESNKQIKTIFRIGLDDLFKKKKNANLKTAKGQIFNIYRLDDLRKGRYNAGELKKIESILSYIGENQIIDLKPTRKKGQFFIDPSASSLTVGINPIANAFIANNTTSRKIMKNIASLPNDEAIEIILDKVKGNKIANKSVQTTYEGLFYNMNDARLRRKAEEIDLLDKDNSERIAFDKNLEKVDEEMDIIIKTFDVDRFDPRTEEKQFIQKSLDSLVDRTKKRDFEFYNLNAIEDIVDVMDMYKKEINALDKLNKRTKDSIIKKIDTIINNLTGGFKTDEQIEKIKVTKRKREEGEKIFKKSPKKEKKNPRVITIGDSDFTIVKKQFHGKGNPRNMFDKSIFNSIFKLEEAEINDLVNSLTIQKLQWLSLSYLEQYVAPETRNNPQFDALANIKINNISGKNKNEIVKKLSSAIHRKKILSEL